MATARTDDEMRAFLASKSRLAEQSGCHLWLGGLDKDGYGQTHYKGKNIRAHRIAYLLLLGPIPDGLVVMHECDTPACINPAHLKLGTNKENNDDKISKGRGRVACGDQHYLRIDPSTRAGEKAAGSKLKEGDVQSIRAKLKAGLPQADIAREFAVSRPCISAIAIGRTWSHLKSNEIN